MSNDAASFYNALRDQKRRRIALDALRAMFATTFPQFANVPDRLPIMMRLLDTLSQQGLVAFPKQKTMWSTYGEVRIPAWIIVAIEVPSRQEFGSIAWMPELSFCAEMRNPAQLEVAARINEFLIRRRHTLKQVPLRERSLEIFGDEKRLDGLVRGGCLFGGKLPLSAIGAIEVPFPLPYQGFPASNGPMLVIENHHTFWSFCEWNKQVEVYSAIIYGGGNIFFRGALALEKIAEQASTREIQYFGDIDAPGFAIPLEFNRAQTSRGHGLCVRPARNWYSWLVAHGRQRPSEEELSMQNEGRLQSWFIDEPELSATILELVRTKKRIPQESLSYENLLSTKATALLN